MKKLTILILLPVLLVSLSCKKKETVHTSESVAKGDLVILEVSDSVECALEYRMHDPSSQLKETPAHATAEFSNGYYQTTIYVYGIGIYGMYNQEPVGFWAATEFPQFHEYYSETFVDSIPGNELERHEVYTVPLDTSKIDFFMTPYYPEEVESGWNKIKDLRIVYEYRMKYPHSKISFLCLKKANGEMKKYFFMNKYKP